MELDPGWLAELVAALDADPGAGSAASKLRMLREPGVLDGAGDLVTWYGATWRRGHGEPDRGQYDEPGVVASPCAGAALYRRAALEEVGGFDERFFAYLEDADWGLRAQLAGWPCRWVPTAVAYHLGGATSRRMGDLETELIARNTLALVLKSFPAARLALWSPLIVATRSGRSARRSRRGSWRAVLRGWAAALRAAAGDAARAGGGAAAHARRRGRWRGWSTARDRPAVAVGRRRSCGELPHPRPVPPPRRAFSTERAARYAASRARSAGDRGRRRPARAPSGSLPSRAAARRASGSATRDQRSSRAAAASRSA